MCRDTTDAPEPEGASDTTPRMPVALERVLGRGKRCMVFIHHGRGACVWHVRQVKWHSPPGGGGTMVCALFGVAALNLMLGCCHMPMGTKRHAQLLAGSLVGSTIGAETFSSASTSVVPALLLFASYWLVNFLFTQVCRHWRLLDVKSAMFASAPGGASDIALIAADLDADLAKIAGIQIMRAVYAVAVMSPLCCCLPPRWGRGPLSGVRGAWGGAARCVWT